MSPQRWQQIEDIFQTAVDLPREDRARYVAEATSGDANLEREVEKLLTQYEESTALIERPTSNDNTTRRALA